jgi:pimeloyl-ACP methyl ester carboxylesterase
MIAIREKGLVATFCPAKGRTTPVIVLGGSGGGIPEARAELLAKQGLPALALAYFNAENLPPALREISLEYFERAIDWLESWCGSEGVALWGGSRGAEVALLLGTLFPKRVKAIAAHVPPSAVYGAMDGTETPAWTYRGQPVIPNAPFPYPRSLTGGKTETAPLATAPIFLTGMQERADFARSAIPVEKLECPLLLISAEDDQVWPSPLFCQQLLERLAAHRSPIERIHLRYPGVGHAPTKKIVAQHPTLGHWFLNGGSAEANALAAADWLHQTAQFFIARL